MRLVMRLALLVLVPSGLLAGEPVVQRFRPVECSATDRILELTVDDALLDIQSCEVVRIEGSRNWIHLSSSVRRVALRGDDNVLQAASEILPQVSDRGRLNVLLPAPESTR